MLEIYVLVTYYNVNVYITARTTAAWNVDFVLESSDPGRLPITIKPTNYLGN